MSWSKEPVRCDLKRAAREEEISVTDRVDDGRNSKGLGLGEGGRTGCEGLVVPLEVCFCALAARADRDGVVLERRARRRKFKQMRTSTVLSDDEEADTVWAAPVFLRVDLCLYWL